MSTTNETGNAPQPFAAATGSGAVPCAVCGCGGNMDCGHAPLDTERCCTLDAAEVCPCCRAEAEHPNDQARRLPPTATVERKGNDGIKSNI